MVTQLYEWISSLILRIYLLMGNLLMCCKPFFSNLSIVLRELLGFSSSVFGWFSKGISSLMVDWFIWIIYLDDLCGWLIYEIHMWMIYLWDSYVGDIKIHMWLIYEIHKCWNCLIKVLKLKYLQCCSNINKVELD